MALIQIERFDDMGGGGLRLASRDVSALGHVLGAPRVNAASVSSLVIARASETLMHDAPRSAHAHPASAALAQQRKPLRLEIAQLTALVTRVDAASRDRVLDLARRVGIGQVGAFPRERSPLIQPGEHMRLQFGDAIQTRADPQLWRMLG